MQQGIRQFPRYKVSVPVQVSSPVDRIPVRTHVAEIGLGGCYVEMSFTRQVSDELELTMWLGEKKVCASGIVVSRHLSFGNGIKFIHVAPESKAHLQQFLATQESRVLRKR